MNSATSLVVNLRRVGVSLRAEGTRLIIEAPLGTVTPEIRRQLVHLKQELLAALAKESGAPISRDQAAIDAVREIAGLLAVGYRRFSAIRRVPLDRHDAQPQSGLALRDGSSLHGVG